MYRMLIFNVNSMKKCLFNEFILILLSVKLWSPFYAIYNFSNNYLTQVNVTHFTLYRINDSIRTSLKNLNRYIK